MKRLFTFILACSALMAISCLAQERIILLNEGSWQADNGSVTYFENGNVVSNHWLRDINGNKLGDTPNDIIQVNDDLIAIAVNSSNIVQFIRPDGTAVAATEDVPNNRKLATDGKYVYVSSYGHECGTVDGTMTFEKGFVAKIDAETFKVVGAVEVGFEPEGVALYDGYLFVANTGGYAYSEGHDYESTVSVVNAATMQLERNVDTGQANLYGDLSLAGKYLCISSPGDYYTVDAAGIIFDCEKALQGSDECFVKIPYAVTYNCTTKDDRFFAVGSSFSYVTYNYEFNYLTIDPSEVMASNGASGIVEGLPGTVSADMSGMMAPYGIYVNPYTGYIYATDACSYAAGGKLYQWSPEGELLGQHETYICPAHFLALPPNGAPVAIELVSEKSNKDAGGCYNLNGIRVNDGYNGIIVVNGKKYLRR